jgi:superfamily I DNA/RNA helicase/RecB family exonuclease
VSGQQASYRLVRAASPDPQSREPSEGPLDPARPDELSLIFDPGQRAVIEHTAGPLRLLGGPGTGKTTALVEAVVARIESGVPPERVLLLAFDRRTAATLRERIARRLGGASGEPTARTWHSYAFAVLHRRAVTFGERTPRLLTGPEHDHVIRELVAGDQLDDPRRWPAWLHPALGTRGFARELRDLLMRASERGVGASTLRKWGRQHGRVDWAATAKFMAQYAAVTALADDTAYDPAELVRSVLDTFQADPEFAERERGRFTHVYVDSYAEADPAQEALLRALADGAESVVVAGDPDQAVYTFRGGTTACLARFPDKFGRAGEPAGTVALDTCYRAGTGLTEAWARIAMGIRGRHDHRPLESAEGIPEGLVEAHVLRSASQQASYVAHRLREAHLTHGIPWNRMAVLVRSTTHSLPGLRRALLAAGVPMTAHSEELPLVAQPAVHALLEVLRLANRPDQFTADEAIGLLASPVGGADSLSLHRLRKWLRRVELAAGGTRSSADVLRAAVEAPHELLEVPAQVAAPAQRIADLVRIAREAAGRGDDAEHVLWEVWAATGLADRWAADSRSGGRRGAAADADLDAVVALFDAAARLVDRLPRSGPDALLDHLLGQQVPGDSLAERAPTQDAVVVTTSHAALGREWDVVAVMGVQEGNWPDLRPRGSLLGSELLVDVVSGVVGDGTPASLSSSGALTRLLDEERRLFYLACSRARRSLLVTAVGDSENEPSRFLDELVPTWEERPRPVTSVPRTLSLPALVAELRSVVADPQRSLAVRRAAAEQLARMAADRVPGAHPDDWYGLQPQSTDAPLKGEDELVRVSPSRVEQFDTCALRWLLEGAGGSTGAGGAQGLGMLVHDAATLAVDDSVTSAELDARIDAGWDAIDVGGPWMSTTQRERARKMVRKLLAWIQANYRDLVAVEEGFEIQLGQVSLHGRIDRLERDDAGRLVIVDLKTGSSAPSKQQAATNPQLGVYQLAIEEGAFPAHGQRPGGAVLVHLGTSAKSFVERTQPPLPDTEDPGWARELLERVAEGMAGSAFTASVNDYCSMCPVRTSCPADAHGGQVTG